MPEAFDQPLPRVFNEARTAELKRLLPTVNAITVWHVMAGEDHLEFVEFRHRGAWEVHFNNSGAEYALDQVHLRQPAIMPRILATAIERLKRRLMKGNPIRYYAESASLMRPYDRVFAHVNRSEAHGRIMRVEVSQFVGPSPNSRPLPAVVLQLDMRTLRLPHTAIDEALSRMAATK